jgi:LacI family transcriptional regulator
MRVTIKDIAKRVGVTPATVSMVINSSPKISQKTKELVQAAIKEMNYHPNYIGRSLVKGNTNNIAVVASFFASLFALESVRGIEASLRNTPYNLILYSTRGLEENEREMMQRLFYERRADGIIVISLRMDKDIFEEFKKERVPIVFLEEVIEGAPTVKFKNIKGGYMATEHFIKNKRKKIGLIIGESGLNAEERLKGYKDALNDYGLPFDENKIVRVRNYNFEEGEKCLKTLLKKSHDVDSIFCAAGDVTAIGVLDQAKKLGIKVPQDIGVIGYDDIYIANLTSPGLTTIRQPIAQMGMQTFDILMGMIDGTTPYESKIISFEPELIIRESV